jgi:cell division protease FtsH
MGGRIAEEMFMNQMTTGASNDFEQATDLARNMVSRWGMSELLGPRVYGENQSEVFLGRDVTTNKNLSESTAEKVDKEISRILEEQYSRAREILDQNRDRVEVMARALMEWETLDSDQIADVMAGKDPRPPEDTPRPKSKPDEPDTPEGEGDSVRPRMDKPASGEA